jgi:large subunit ribosomal protein L23
MDILVRPIVTEKMNKQSEKLNRYGFIVDNGANKIQIKNAVEQFYNVTVDDVNTMRYQGKKSVRFTKAGLIAGKKSAFKKAIVTLAKGETIDFYSNI